MTKKAGERATERWEAVASTDHAVVVPLEDDVCEKALKAALRCARKLDCPFGSNHEPPRVELHLEPCHPGAKVSILWVGNDRNKAEKAARVTGEAALEVAKASLLFDRTVTSTCGPKAA